MDAKKLNDKLKEIIKKSDVCQHCIFCHGGEICFFAYGCLSNGTYSNFQDEREDK